ncbi:MAG: glycosyltransferase family protein [Bacteroidota bacterium]
MKILYAIQGTGNGHLSRAEEVLPVLKKYAEVDVVISGKHAELKLNHEVKFKYGGLGFIFGKKGGIDLKKSFLKNNLFRYFREIRKIPVKDYDLVINDFEPVSAWACFFRGVPCVSLSHQSAVISKNAPKSELNDPLGWFFLKNYAPVQRSYGFHFETYDDSTYTPIIRSDLRNSEVTNEGHYTVYLPAYSDKKIISFLENFPKIKWEVFSKHTKKNYSKENIKIRCVDATFFKESLLKCEGVLCGAGFETPSEALFLRKKLLVVPMSNQFEQHCNAAALKAMGIPVIDSLNKRYLGVMKKFIKKSIPIAVNYADKTEKVVEKIISDHKNSKVSLEYEYLAKNLEQAMNAISLNTLAGKLKY